MKRLVTLLVLVGLVAGTAMAQRVKTITERRAAATNDVQRFALVEDIKEHAPESAHFVLMRMWLRETLAKREALLNGKPFDDAVFASISAKGRDVGFDVRHWDDAVLLNSTAGYVTHAGGIPDTVRLPESFSADVDAYLAKYPTTGGDAKSMSIAANAMQFTLRRGNDADFVARFLSHRITLSRLLWAKKQLVEEATSYAMASLRKEGKSFVTLEKTNPITAKLKAVVDAVNAPNCVGLEAALRGIGMEIADQERALTQAQADKVKAAVMAGETKADDLSLGIILFTLGTDGFNAFVKEYNEGPR